MLWRSSLIGAIGPTSQALTGDKHNLSYFWVDLYSSFYFMGKCYGLAAYFSLAY